MPRTTITVPTPGAGPPPSPEDGPESPAQDTERLARSPLASLMIVLAIGMLAVVLILGLDSTVKTFDYGISLTIVVLVCALAASLWPNALAREGLFLLWNGLGLSIGLLAIGLLGMSAMLGLPPVLLGLAITVWPRWPGQSLSPLLDRIVLIAGMLVLPLLALAQWLLHA